LPFGGLGEISNEPVDSPEHLSFLLLVEDPDVLVSVAV